MAQAVERLNCARVQDAKLGLLLEIFLGCRYNFFRCFYTVTFFRNLFFLGSEFFPDRARVHEARPQQEGRLRVPCVSAEATPMILPFLKYVCLPYMSTTYLSVYHVCRISTAW